MKQFNIMTSVDRKGTVYPVKLKLEGDTAIQKFPADLVRLTEEILDGKLHFLCSGNRLNKDITKGIIN